MWLEELIPNYYIDLSNVLNINEKNILIIKITQKMNELFILLEI